MVVSTSRVDEGFLETSPLVPHRIQERAHKASISPFEWICNASPRFTLQTAYFILPVIFGACFISVVTDTTTIQIYEQVVCRRWLASHSPTSLPINGSLPVIESCKIPGVKQSFSFVIAAETFLKALGAIITSIIINHVSPRYGRKPLVLVLLSLNVISTAFFLRATKYGIGTLQALVLVASVIISALSGAVPISLICNIYVTDMTEQYERTSVFSISEGFGALGNAAAYALGGYLSHNFTAATVYWWKLFIIMTIMLYVYFALPESFSGDKQGTARSEVDIETDTPWQAHRNPKLLPVRLSNVLKYIIGPLSYLWPSYNPTTGVRNFRLLTIAASEAFVCLGGFYIGPAFITYSKNHWEFDSDQLSLALGVYAWSRVICLWVPAILPRVRTFYDSSDVFVATASSLLWAFAVLLIGLAPSAEVLMAALALIALSSGQGPSIRSATTASVAPSISGNVLSALAIVTSTADLLAPVVFGAIQSLMSEKPHELVFFVCAATILVGAVLMYFVRNADRYITVETRGGTQLDIPV